ncbi:amidohydrolase family protein [Treponema primitia]|uniref:amidohydrolase family protein n=1 Tax=Treponema primitia TaxID=88058 RepID=UPI0003139E95|nr:amidohydrolase family protein [Treponema primitia]
MVDAAGGYLTPGFIDVHSHTDNHLVCAEKLLAQGITTVLSGNCGISPVDFSRFFAEFEETGFPIHQAEQVGHSSLRAAAGQDNVYAPSSRDQLIIMKELAKKAFAEGAYGLSFGLEYVPGSPPEEVLELAQLAADAQRLISIHTRLTKLNDVDSLREALEIAPRTGARVIISHLVYMFTGDGLKRAIELINTYRQRGADVWADSGVYTAFATGAGTPVFDEKVFFEWGMSFDRLRAGTGKYAGQFLDLEKYREIRRDSPGDSLIYDAGTPDDIFTAYSLDDVMVSTDSGENPPGQGHPQSAATFPRFLRVLVKERGQLSLLEALRRCTLIPARALGLAQKGRLAEGADADLVVLDWERLREAADFPGFGNPDAPPQGVKLVFVGGKLVIKDEQRLSGVYAGKSLHVK